MASPAITIVDYGMGNIGSLLNMFRRIGAQAEVSADPAQIAQARKILLPGVGAFDAAMERIDALGLRDLLRTRALDDKVPFMGICLGMQLLGRASEEGTAKGLDLIPAEARRFPSSQGIKSGLKVPHMGWNAVEVLKQTPLTESLPPDPRFYFVHSYFMEADAPADRMLACTYGQRFDAGLHRGNVYGAQFHPEKSHKFGMALLRGFASLPC